MGKTMSDKEEMFFYMKSKYKMNYIVMTKLLHFNKWYLPLLIVLLSSFVETTKLHAQSSLPEGALNGLFSVSENTQVRFSQGNLQYQASTSTWRFAENQWDYVGSTNSKISQSYNGWIDLFGWGTSGYNHGATCYQPWSTSDDYNTGYFYYGAYGRYDYNLYDNTAQADWGYNAIINGGNTENYGWYTLTDEEWYYLYKSRSTTSGIRYAKANVNNVNGVILLPDDWRANYYSLSDTNDMEARFYINTISQSQWATLEQHGAVFLPAAGRRYHTSVEDVNSDGHYWSSSSNTSFLKHAYCLDFDNDDLNCYHNYRYYGYSVRLVRFVQDCSVTVNPSIAEGGAVSGQGIYSRGSYCTLTANAFSGYTFLYWTENGWTVSYDAEYSFRAVRNRNLIAVFSNNSGNGVLTGLFSVNASGEQVQFSQGNLQYQASTNTWRFSGNQWDYIGGFNMSISQTNTGWIDLFGWGTSNYNHGAVCYYPWATSKTPSDYYAYGGASYSLYDQTGKADWGYNAISNGGNQTNLWRTLSIEEWKYVLNTRSTSSGIRYAIAKVNKVMGIILLPDDWSSSYYSLNHTNSSSWGYDENVISMTQWATLEQHGAVFLPCGGDRTESPLTYPPTYVIGAGSHGSYWSSSCSNDDDTRALSVSTVASAKYDFRHIGNSVRLVRPFKSYSINAYPNPAAGGSISGVGIYEHGATCTLMATPATGYHFVNWTQNGSQVSTNLNYQFTVTAARTLVANFAPNTYTVTLNTNNGTINSGNVISYTYGVGATLPTNVTRTGYTFGGWYDNANLSGTAVTTISTTATGNKTFWAKWNNLSYVISATANPTVGGTVSGAGSYNYGASCTVTATPATGYNFTKWTKNGTQVSTSASYTFTVNGAATYVAQFTKKTYTITATANPTAGGSITGTGTYEHGSSCTLTATPATGYSFVNWTSGNSQVSTNASYQFTVTGARTLVANFAPNTYTVTLNTNDGTINSGNVTSYTYGEGATLPTDVTRTGYTFGGWYDNSGLTGTAVTSISTTATGNKTFWAKWTINSYAIGVSANPTAGGTVTGAGNYNYGASCTLTATPATGYNFTKWTKNNAQVSTSANYTFTVTEAADYVAVFTKKTYTITATANPTAGGTITGAGTYEHGASCTLTATANTGYHFVNWTQNGSQVSTNASYQFTVTGGKTLVANFAPNTYTVTLNTNEGIINSGNVTSYTYGVGATLPTDVTRTGYTFGGWYANANLTGTAVTSIATTATGDKTFWAKWTINSYTIGASANPTAGGTVSGADTYNYGASCTLTATPATGYNFTKWTKNNTQVSTSASYTFTVTEAADYVAVFTKKTYSIIATANPTAGGTITGAGTYEHGSSCTLVATPATGYSFVNWTQNGTQVSTNASYQFTVTGGKTLVANFAPNTYMVTLNTNDGTINSGNVTSYTYGVGATLPTDVTRTGYTFGGWYDNANLSGTAVTSISITATGNKTFWAKWTINSYTIGASANPTAGGTVSGAGTYNYGASCTLTATPNTGNTFVNWTENGTTVSTDATYSFTVTGPRTLVANFSLNSYSVTVTADPVEGGTITGAGTYAHGANVTLTATANTGYTFVNWTRDGVEVSTSPAYSFTVTGPGNYAAHFSLNSYEVLTGADPEVGGTVTGGGTYNYGETATLTATANEGYTFDHWSDGYASEYFTIESLEDGNTITLTIGALVTQAQMQSISYSIDDGATWNTTTIDDTEQVISVSVNVHEKVLWKGTGVRMATSWEASSWCSFNGTKQHIVYGNIASLLFGDDFEGQTVMPTATNNDGRNYQRLFSGDTKLVSAQHLILPFTTLRQICYWHMFNGCTSLTTAPEVLPATTLPYICYGSMFLGCSSLTTVPDLPATALAQECYAGMFRGCTSLKKVPELPATTMATKCYEQMFMSCTSLTTAPALPGTTLASYCYRNMFQGCTSLTRVPGILPAMELQPYCYSQMFRGCTALNTSPILPAPVLVERCYEYMFNGDSSLNKVTCLATDISASDPVVSWMTNVGQGGTFYKHPAMTAWPQPSGTGIPGTWTVVDNTTDYQTPFEEQYFTIESLEDGNTITLTIGSAVTSAQMSSISYSTDNGATWNTTTIDNTTQTISVTLNNGQKAIWKGLGRCMASGYNNETQWSIFTGTKHHIVYGNIASLLFGDDFVGQIVLPGGTNNGRNYQALFRENANLVSAHNLVIPFTILQNNCYAAMFQSCTSLTSAPELPAMNMTQYCYSSMFRYCSSLISVPVLPSLTMSYACYSSMFQGCTSLTQAPELPAPTLVSTCYQAMFTGCTSLNEVTCLATDISATNCTASWLNGVASIGTFHKASSMNDWPTGVSGIPSDWTAIEPDPVDPTEPNFSYMVTDDRYWLAHFTLNSYDITASANPNEGGAVTGSGTYNHFDNCTLTAAANTGYTFVNWTKEGNAVSNDAEYTFQVSDAGDYVANFSLNSYVIAASANPIAGGTVTGAGSYNHFESCTLTANASEGYTFVNWTENGTEVSTDATFQFTVTGERSLVANFSLNSYDITASANPNAGGTVTGAGTFNHGETCSLTASAAEGYTFVNWTENGTEVSTDAIFQFTVTGACSLVANFNLNSYDITASANPTEGGTVTGAGSYNHGESCSLTASATEGYTFVNWTENGTEVSPETTFQFTVTGGRSLTANFSLNSYDITASANPTAGGTVNGAGTFNHGETCSLTATAADGYTFENWTENGVEVTREMAYTFTVTGARTLVANFSLDIYAVTAEANPTEGGTVAGEGFVDGEGDFAYGSTCSVTATANEGYTFVNWAKFGVEVATTATYTFTVEAPTALVANFSLNSYDITATANPIAGGTVNGAGTFNHGENVTLSATANEGYTFVNWTENGEEVSTDLTYLFTVTGERSLTANFSLNSYEITAEVNPTEGGTVTGTGTYNHFDECTLTATANEGYTFVNWTENGEEVSTDLTYLFTVTGDRSLVANFVETITPATNHWTPQSSAFAFNMTLTGVIQINGVEQTSDQLEVGAFCGDECRGSQQTYYFAPAQRYIVQLIIYGETGDMISFRLYDHATEQEIDLVSPAPVAFNADGYGSLSNPYVLNFSSSITQTTALTQGWNWWGTYIELAGNDGLSQLENSLGEHGLTIKSRENGFAEPFSDGSWYGNLTSLCNEQMYMIRTDADCEASVTGQPAIAANHPITLNPGWTWIGFPSQQPMSVGTAMSGITPQGDDIVKGRNGYATYYAGDGNWYGTLNTLEPGQGYMYQSLGDEAKTLVYNTNRSEATRANVTPEHNMFKPYAGDYANNMTLTAVVELNGHELRQEGYELAAFVGDECRGSVKLLWVAPLDRYVAFLTVFGEQDETLTFCLTDGTAIATAAEKQTFTVDATLGTLTSPVVLRFGNLGIDDSVMPQVSVYPNPSDGVFQVEGTGIERVEVYNTLGQRVFMEKAKADMMSVDLRAQAEGLYTLRVVTANGVSVHNIVKR